MGPDNTIYPHAMDVGAGNQVFAANKYQVFRFSVNGGEATKVETVDCNLNETIMDVIADCDNAGTCWPYVLVAGKASKLVNCTNGETIAHLQHGPSLAPRQ